VDSKLFSELTESMEEMNQIIAKQERWTYIKNLRPSPGRYIHINEHPNRVTRLRDNLHDVWTFNEESGRLECDKQPINTPYRNPIKNQRRQAIKVRGGTRQYKRQVKAFRRLVAISEELGLYEQQ
jgi:hypothetical protein